jgi:hypothetical protein
LTSTAGSDCQPLWFQFWFELDWGHRARTCSIGARGLWIELLMIIQKPPVGWLAIGDITLNKAKLPALTAVDPSDFDRYFSEILAAGLLAEDPADGYYPPVSG